MHSEQAKATELGSKLARQVSLFEPIRDVWKNSIAHVRTHGLANESLFIGEQCRDVDEVDGVRRRQRFKTRASLSKSASVERSN